MNKNIYDEILKDYSFLDDFEQDFQNEKAREAMGNKKSPPKPEEVDFNKRYLNNYPEMEKNNDFHEDKKDEMDKSKGLFNRSRYGDFVNRNLDLNKLDDEKYVYENLNVPKVNSNSELNEYSHKEVLKDANETVKKLEYRYYAFLNKEFNILNKKMIKCSMICYDNPNLFTVNEAKMCAEKCHYNIKEAKKFAEKVHEREKEKLTKCLEEAAEFSKNNSEDKISSFFTCYKTLAENFKNMENEIKTEFSNYI